MNHLLTISEQWYSHELAHTEIEDASPYEAAHIWTDICVVRRWSVRRGDVSCIYHVEPYADAARRKDSLRPFTLDGFDDFTWSNEPAIFLTTSALTALPNALYARVVA